MRGDEHRLALLVCQLSQQAKHQDSMRQVQMRCGFIQKDDRRLLRQGFRNQDPLFLAVRVRVEKRPSYGLTKAHFLQGLRNDPLVLSGQSA